MLPLKPSKYTTPMRPQDRDKQEKPPHLGGSVIYMHFDLRPVLQEGLIGLGALPDGSSAPNRLMN